MTTFIRAFALMLALTGFSAVTYTGSTAASSNSGKHVANTGGTMGAPVCTNNLPNCGLD